jgi:hypothetical protein
MPTMTTTPLLDFYVRLGEDEDLLEDFERDPQAAFERAGLSGDAIATLLDGDLDTIRATLREEIRNAPRSEYEGPGEHTPDEGPGEHTPDDDDEGGGEHTPDDAPGEHTPDE